MFVDLLIHALWCLCSVTVEMLDRDVWVKAIRDAQDAEELGAAFASLAENVASDWLQVCRKHAMTSLSSRVPQSLLCCFFVRLVGSRICVVTLRADFFVGLCRHKRCPDILRLFVQPWYLSMYNRAGLSPGWSVFRVDFCAHVFVYLRACFQFAPLLVPVHR